MSDKLKIDSETLQGYELEMRILWLSTMVATSWTLQVSRYDIRGRSVHRTQFPLSLQSDVDLDDITLLRAKLDILQAVVKELYRNCVIVENNETPLLGQDSDIQNKPLTVNENRRISNLCIQEKNTVATLSSDLKSCCNEIQHLREVLDQKDKDLHRAEALAAAEIENYKELRRIWEANEDRQRQELLSRDRLAHEERVKNDVMIKELQAVSNKQRDEIMSLREKLETCETKWQESTAIASASVEAAETRSTNFASELRMLERRKKKAQVFCHLQRLVIKGLLKEM